jgi:hypothetical protein
MPDIRAFRAVLSVITHTRIHHAAALRSAALFLLPLLAPATLWPQSTADPVLDAMPDSTTIAIMEDAVPGARLDAFRATTPAPFWLFGEHRRLAVRNSIIPARWFTPGAAQDARFAGSARPGEFYTFQIAVLADSVDLHECSVTFAPLRSDGGRQIDVQTMRCLSLGGTDKDGFPFRKHVTVQARHVTPLWVGIAIPPATMAGRYTARWTVQAGDDAIPFAVEITVSGQPVDDGGIRDAWRLARLQWLDSRIAQGDSTVTRPFIPITVDIAARTLGILGRRVTLAATGLPAQYTSYFSGSNTTILQQGSNAFTVPPAFTCSGLTNTAWESGVLTFTRITPAAVSWRATSTAGPLALTVNGTLEYDGFMSLRMDLRAGEAVTLPDIRLSIPWKPSVARYAMGLGLKGQQRPQTIEWHWDVARHQDALWLGDVNCGAMVRLKDEHYQRPLINLYYDSRPLLLPRSWGTGGVVVETRQESVVYTAYTGPRTLAAGDTLHFVTDWYFTPFKTLDPHKHFTDRYYHPNQGTGMEDPAWLRSNGATVMNIHHNKEANPFINYPYSDASLGVLRDYIARAHAESLRVKIYYTTRELTQNLPEFFALYSLNGEVMIPRRPGVPWTIINPEGPHPWLRQHVGMDIIPAWKETIAFPRYGGKLDLAVITTPDSRWNNFYLEGLQYLVRTAAIDGLYVDDTALDRVSMRRARRILDADGNTGRRIDMHSWNHFNAMAGFASCSIVFMEHYPYYDRLWHGEMFDATSPPDYWLVEMSGIPFGLMSEMLQDGGNVWRGMLFGMTQRWPWSGDPRPLWKAMDDFGITDASFTGWWDASCPVLTGNPGIRASVYRRDGRILVALASWAAGPVEVRLQARAPFTLPARFSIPAISGVQEGGTVDATRPLIIEPGKGLLLVGNSQ